MYTFLSRSVCDKAANTPLSGPRPLVVVLPGIEGTGELLAPFCEELGHYGFDTLVIPYPNDRPLGYDDLVTYVEAHLPQNRRFILLGESFGGPLATRIAAQQPNCVGLILAVTFLRARSFAAPFMRFSMKRPPVFKIPKTIMVALLAGLDCSTTVMSQIFAMFHAANPEVIRNRSREALIVDARIALSSLTIPVLAIHASHDCIVPTSVRQDFIRNAKDIDSVIIRGPHLLLATRVADAGYAVNTWWEKQMQTKVAQEAALLAG